LQGEGEIDAPIGPHPTAPRKMSVLKHGGRPARTLWRVESRFRDVTCLRISPKTGKTHQIRVHLAHIGLPIAVDPLYNPRCTPILLSEIKRDYRPKRCHDQRTLTGHTALHAEQIEFVHPRQQSMRLRADPPKDFRAV